MRAAACFDQWRTHVKDSIHLRVVGARVVKRMLKMKLAFSFDQWKRQAQEKHSYENNLPKGWSAVAESWPCRVNQHVERLCRET